MKETITLSKDHIKTLDEMGQIVRTPDGGIYKFMPYWFRETDKDDVYEVHLLGILPKDLEETIRDDRERRKE